jgi:DNA-binding beta-propeller fold protein YncE
VLRHLVLLVCASSQMAAAAQTEQSSPLPAPVYTVAKSWHVGGADGWQSLALEASGARLYIARGDRVDVVETVSGRLAGSIPSAGARAVAFSSALVRGFISNGTADSVTVFAQDTLHVIQEVPISGRKPDAILYEPRHNHVFTANVESSNLSVIDAETLQPSGTVALPGPPQFMVTDGSGTVYINIATTPGKLAAVDSKSFAIKVWPLPGCANPGALAFDAMHRRLFSVCDNQTMAVTDSQTGRQAARIVVGGGAEAAAYDPALNLVFSSNGADGTLTVIHEESPDEYRVVATVTTQPGARSLVLDPATHTLFLAAGKLGPAPAASDAQPRARPSIVSGSFSILVAQPK